MVRRKKECRYRIATRPFVVVIELSFVRPYGRQHLNIGHMAYISLLENTSFGPNF